MYIVRCNFVGNLIDFGFISLFAPTQRFDVVFELGIVDRAVTVLVKLREHRL